MFPGLILLDSPPGQLPDRFASPFDHAEPHPLARRAADDLQRELREGRVVDLSILEAARGGKMFGVLVVATADNRVGYLRGFSGMLGGQWLLEGFVPPLFDPAEREAIWPESQSSVRPLEKALLESKALKELRAELVAAEVRQSLASDELRARHRENREARHRQRDGLSAASGSEEERTAARQAIDQLSRADGAEARRQKLAHQLELEGLQLRLGALESERSVLELRRAEESRALMREVHDGYTISNARGGTRPLRELFAPGEPPGGAGDCAGPKLLGQAYRLGLRPVALAEFWWGAPPLSGGRVTGAYYPSCRGKCGPLLPYMMDGLPVVASAIYGAGAIAADEPRVVFEDAWLMVVDKPVGLLSVPGRHAQLRDSVLTRLRARCADAVLVHRLDLDTSGLMLCAKDAETHVALQRQFARREVEKRYVAWLEGVIANDEGRIELALRVDVSDRPRQIHDPIYGKAAVTDWRVLERTASRTRVAFFPRTGRTHQLRVHASHAMGLGAAIVGDRLYGREDSRLMLHAEALSFIHPRTKVRVEFERAAPF
jgi:tRNA pseudouridine32 synthase/23S rRNA pseudouridine746 synthase